MTMKTPLLLALPLSALALAGCGNIQTVKSFSTPYEQPGSGERARIRIVADGMVRAVPNSHCENWRLPGSGVMVSAKKGFADQNGRSLGMPGADTAETADRVVSEFYVPAGKPLMLSYISNGRVITIGNGLGSAQCIVRKSFTPEAGADYEASFRHVGPQCLASVTELQTQGDTTLRDKPVPLADAKLCRGGDIL